MKKRIFIIFLFLIFIFISLYTNISYATFIEVTDENLNDALQKFVNSDTNEEKYKISLSNDSIKITIDNDDYILNYDLTDKPTFSFEIPIKKGMSYEEFKKQTEALILPMIGYVATANIQGVEIEDASSYFLFSYLENAFNGSFSTEDAYMIVDDLNLAEGVTINKTDDPKTIYTSEFGERVIEYVDSMYKDEQVMKDSTGINSYTFSTKKQDKTENYCKLVSEVIVNKDADFSKLEGYSKEIGDSVLNKNITKENADYNITLKVGQKCIIESSEKIQGYEIYGGCIDFDKERNEITAKQSGDTNGYLYVGNTKKSFYVTVEENTENKTLDTVILKLDKINNNSNTNDNINPNTTNKNENKSISTTTTDKTIADSKIPKAGLTNTMIFIVITIFTVGIIRFGIKLKEYKCIK